MYRVVNMDIRDIGLLALLITWIDTIIYSIYLSIAQSIPITTLNNLLEIGRNPALFLINLTLFYISIYILIRYGGGEKEILKRMVWAYPLVTLTIALVYSISIAGLEGISFLVRAPFIAMYTFLTQMTLFIAELDIKTTNITPYIRENIVILILTAELFIYIALRIVFGGSPILTSTFLILAVATMGIYTLRK